MRSIQGRRPKNSTTQSNSVVGTLSRWPGVPPSSALIIRAASGIASPMAAQFSKPYETPSNFSTILIGVALNPIPKPSVKLPWWAMSEPGEYGEIGSSLLPLLFRLNDLWRLALQPFGNSLVSLPLYLLSFRNPRREVVQGGDKGTGSARRSCALHEDFAIVDVPAVARRLRATTQQTNPSIATRRSLRRA